MLQMQHCLGTFSPHDASLIRVGNLFRVASHMLKACLGTAPLNQTIEAQFLVVPRRRSTSQVLAAEKPTQS